MVRGMKRAISRRINLDLNVILAEASSWTRRKKRAVRFNEGESGRRNRRGRKQDAFPPGHRNCKSMTNYALHTRDISALAIRSLHPSRPIPATEHALSSRAIITNDRKFTSAAARKDDDYTNIKRKRRSVYRD